MKFTGVKETCLYSANLELTKNFYAEKLGLEVVNYLANRHLFLRVGHSMLLFFNPEDSRQKTAPPGHYASGKMHIALEVPQKNYLETKKQILNSGVAIIHEESWPSGLTSFYFEDPNGHVLEVVPAGLWGD